MQKAECRKRSHRSSPSAFCTLHSALMKDIRSLFADYAAYHQTPGNKVFHRVGIPLIMLTLIGMLARAGVGHLNAAVALIAVAEIVYFMLEWRLAIAMLIVSVALVFGGWAIPFWFNVALFLLRWMLQFIGHIVHEHQSAAFLTNFLHLLVGPLWILNDVVPVVR